MRKNHRIFTEWILLAAFIIVPVIYILVGIIGSISELKTWNSDHEDDSYNENCFSYDDYMEYGDSMYDIGKEYGFSLITASKNPQTSCKRVSIPPGFHMAILKGGR